MDLLKNDSAAGPETVTRRSLFSILPARTAGCLACAHAALCGQDARLQMGLSWTENSDMTWEQVFRFAYQKDLIPLLKELAAQMGREKFVAAIRKASDDVVARKTAGRPPQVAGLTALAAALSNPPPLMQHALDAEILERSPQAFVYRVKRCLWANVFRDEDAGDIGYAMVCYPDYAVARGLNPKLRLIRSRTLMQGDGDCVLRYELES